MTGLTQLSGKTTTLEALIKRGGFRAVAFRTKIGETGFSEGFIVRPFFTEKSDWQYVESLLEATMRERLKFERSWIIKASKGAKSLEEVYENCKKLQASSRDSSLQYGVYTTLIAYFEIILPQISKIEFSRELILKDGVNIMDLEKLSDEVQSLVIRSVIDHVLRHEKNTIVIIPEAWKFLPQDKGNPVKAAAIAFVRQGATNRNFLWIDSQDLAGVDKTVLKQVANWILGLQTERNEVQHTLDQIPLPNALKPPPEEIMTLKIGHFIVCNPDFTKKIYMMPAWLDVETSKSIAMGTLPVEAVMGKKKLKLKDVTKFDELALSTLREELKKASNHINALDKENSRLRSRVEELKASVAKTRPDKGLMKKYNWIVDSVKKIAERFDTVQFDTTTNATDTAVELPMPHGFVPAPEGEYHVIRDPNSQTLAVPREKNLMLQKLGGMAQKIYDVLLQNPQGLTKPQIGLMTGYVHTSGSFSNAMSRLNTMGLIKKDGEQYKVV